MGFDDIKAIGAKIGLEACMLGEELLILGGNTSVRARHHADAVAGAVDLGRHAHRGGDRPTA